MDRKVGAIITLKDPEFVSECISEIPTKCNAEYCAVADEDGLDLMMINVERNVDEDYDTIEIFVSSKDPSENINMPELTTFFESWVDGLVGTELISVK